MKEKTKTSDKEAQKRKAKLLEIRKKLVKQKEELLAEAGLALNTMPETQQNFAEAGDQASSDIGRNFLLRLKDRERKLLKKIELAIENIDKGTYGYCEACGCEISIKRLEARPVTTLCIDCKTEQEEEEKLKG